MKYLKKIIILILIQAFLVMNTAIAGGFELARENKAVKSALSPQISIDVNAFKHSYGIYIQKRFLTEDVLLQGLISSSDIAENGTIINDKTTNFKIGEHNFRVPPYLANRVARVHVTAIDSIGFEFQKMGIGAGRRKKTIAVILADISDAHNQLLVFEDKGAVKLRRLGVKNKVETVALGKKARFGSMRRQDSFLERSALGVEFLDRMLELGESKTAKPREAVSALKTLSITNPKLEKKLPVNLAFFSRDYMISFSEGLKKHSHIAVLRDREQRGRFIAIVDKLNPDNRVVFERRGERVYILGGNERVIIHKLKKHKKTQVIYFTDIKEGAQFCRNVTRNLVEINFTKKSHSLSIRKKVQLNVGPYNPDVSVLKVNQVTQSTVTGYQIKKRAPEFMEEVFAAYPVYILREDFQHEISAADVEIDYESSDFIFFNPEDTEIWPYYLSFGNAENTVYYQRLKGTCSYKGQYYVVYRAIGKEDILTSLSFSNDGSFTIKGINWKDGKAVVFRNVGNIALSNIVTQLNSSRFIDIHPVLDEYFDVTDFEPGLNPVRSTYKFKNGVFEQGPNVKMKGLIDFTEIQEKEDKRIQKVKSFELKIPKAALILSPKLLVTSRNIIESFLHPEIVNAVSRTNEAEGPVDISSKEDLEAVEMLEKAEKIFKKHDFLFSPKNLGSLADNIQQNFNSGKELSCFFLESTEGDIPGFKQKENNLNKLMVSDRFKKIGEEDYIYLVLLKKQINRHVPGKMGHLYKISVFKKKDIKEVVELKLIGTEVEKGVKSVLFLFSFRVEVRNRRFYISYEHAGRYEKLRGKSTTYLYILKFFEFICQNFQGGIIIGDFSRNSMIQLFKKYFKDAYPEYPVHKHEIFCYGDVRVWMSEIPAEFPSAISVFYQLFSKKMKTISLFLNPILMRSI